MFEMSDCYFDLGVRPSATFLPVDHETYWFDLSSSNRDSSLSHGLEYSALADLGLADLSPTGWSELAHRLMTDKDAFARYRRFFYRDGPAADSRCNERCRRDLACAALTSENGRNNCQDLDRALRERRKNDLAFFNVIWNH